MKTATTNDDLDILDFAHMNPPNFVTQVGSTLVLTPSESFTGATDSWTKGNAMERRNLLLDVGNAHLAEVQLQRLHLAGRQHVLDHLPERLPLEDAVQYTRAINAAIKAAPPPPQNDKDPSPLPQRRASPDELEAYRRCLLVRAAAFDGAIHGVPVVALSMGVLDHRTLNPNAS